MEEHKVILGMVWYRHADYQRLKKLFPDGRKLQSTYSEWLKDAARFEKEARDAGRRIERVYLNADEFSAWCSERGLSMDADARSEFAACKARAKHEQGPEA